MIGWIVAGVLLWAVLAVPAAVLIGRATRLADSVEQTEDAQ